MRKITVSQYAKQFRLTNQAVYKRIKRGSLNVENINGTQYVLVDELEVLEQETGKSSSDNSSSQLINVLREQIEKKDEQIKSMGEQIKSLNRQLERAVKIQEDILEDKRQNNLLMGGLQNGITLKSVE